MGILAFNIYFQLPRNAVDAVDDEYIPNADNREKTDQAAELREIEARLLSMGSDN